MNQIMTGVNLFAYVDYIYKVAAKVHFHIQLLKAICFKLHWTTRQEGNLHQCLCWHNHTHRAPTNSPCLILDDERNIRDGWKLNYYRGGPYFQRESV